MFYFQLQESSQLENSTNKETLDKLNNQLKTTNQQLNEKVICHGDHFIKKKFPWLWTVIVLVAQRKGGGNEWGALGTDAWTKIRWVRVFFFKLGSAQRCHCSGSAKPLFKSKQENMTKFTKLPFCQKLIFWNQTSSCKCSKCLYCVGKVSDCFSKSCGTSWFPHICTIYAPTKLIY